MTGNHKVVATLFETMCIGLLSGIAGSVLQFFAIYLKAEVPAQELNAVLRVSYRCSTSMAAFALAILSIPAGVIFGLCLGGFFLWRKSVAERRPLP